MDLLDGRYELLGLLGHGGMAQVHRAHDRVLDRVVAVKVLRQATELDDAAAARHRFAAESRLLARLDHPGLVTLLDVGTSTGHPYFVMELVDGGTLGEHLTGTPLDPVLVASIGAQVADALAHAHAHGVVHRDVKPGNVLLASDGRAKLADFGIARLLGEAATVTRTGNTVGTVAYLAPEQVRGEEVTPGVDVYALGLVLLEALTGARAYPGTSTESAFARLHHSPVIPLSLPSGWPRVLSVMTAADATARPTAAAAAVALRALATGKPLTALHAPDPTVEVQRTESVPLAGARRSPRRPRRPVLVAAAAAVAVAVVGASALVPDAAVSREQTPPPATSSPGGADGAQPAAPPSSRAPATPTQQASTAPARPARSGSQAGRDGRAGRSGPAASVGNGAASGPSTGRGTAGKGAERGRSRGADKVGKSGGKGGSKGGGKGGGKGRR